MCRATFRGRHPQTFTVEGIGSDVIQASKAGPRIMRYELTDFEWTAVRSFLPNKPRGVPRVDDRRVLNGIFGSYAQVLPGAICRKPMVLAPLAITASFVGGGL